MFVSCKIQVLTVITGESIIRLFTTEHLMQCE